MNEYTDAYLKTFSWAKQAYEYMLGMRPNETLEITQDSLTAPIVSELPTNAINIFTDSDWNFNSKSQISTLGGIYHSIDQAEKYYNSLYTIITSRMAESERRIQEQDSNLKVLLSASRNVASTSIHIKGGDTTSIESKEEYYRTFGPLESVPNEGIFRLKDTGSFSSIRSLGGFAGQIEFDFTLGQLVENGDLKYIADGARHTFWAGTFYTPAPMRADQNDIPWLPLDYKHGFACMLTYYMDRPTLATEVYIEPVVTEPMDLVSISWTPIDITSSIINGTFASSGNWTYTGAVTFLSSSLGLGTASGSCIMAYSTSGWVSQTFSVSGSYLASGAAELTSFGRRCQVHYDMMGKGDLYAGVRLVWLDASGSVIEYKKKEDYPSGFFTTHKLVDYIPLTAASGRIDVGIFTQCTSASAYIDNVQVFLGEREFQCQEIIDRPKTISLPEIARSGRFSFVLAQRNPRREVLAKESVTSYIPEIIGNPYIEPSIQNATSNISANLKSSGPGTSIFSYRIGMKELDLKYREHIPRGSMVSLPLFTRREIRQIWITSEIGQFFNDNTKFYIYPFADNTHLKTEIQPYGIGEVDAASTSLLREGELLKIHTYEEQTAGWTNLLDKVYITDPKSMKEDFDGTDREGKVRLQYAPHLRRVYLKNIQDWLKIYGIWASPFDPNLETIYGLPANMSTTKDDIRAGTASGFELDDLISRQGYIPLKVTISTDKWTAVPDIFGRPDLSKVRTVSLEELTETTTVETTVNVRDDVIGFDSWINSISLRTFGELMYGGWKLNSWGSPNFFGYASINQDKLDTITVKRAYDSLVSSNPGSKAVYDNYLQTSYEALKAQGKIAKSTNSTHTVTNAVEVGDTYTTRFKPIILGPSGVFIKLYWYDPTTVTYIPMSRSAYEVTDPSIGLIRVLNSAPSSGYTSVLADYKYISYTEAEDHFGSVISFAVAASTATGANVIGASKPFPITRNMTDYEDGKIPELHTPNFDRLSRNYYPIIEYYVNNDGDLIFARDFFRYGDMPAKISVEYQTLAIQPRVAVEITRSGSPAVTPTIYNVSLRVRESSPLPTRENV